MMGDYRIPVTGRVDDFLLFKVIDEDNVVGLVFSNLILLPAEGRGYVDSSGRPHGMWKSFRLGHQMGFVDEWVFEEWEWDPSGVMASEIDMIFGTGGGNGKADLAWYDGRSHLRI